MARGDRAKARKDEAAVVDFLQRRAAEVSDSDAVRKNRSIANTVGREVLFAQHLRAALRGTFLNTPLANPARVRLEKPRGKATRILNLVISDTHYGSSLDPRETGNKYGPVEEARRTAHIVKQAATYKRDHRAETVLYLHLLGDLIQGQLHDQRDGLPLAEQVAACVRILVQAVRFLGAQFPRGVKVFCTPGNHGRNTGRHRDRAVLQKWDSIETMIYVALKEAAAFMPNVEVALGYEPKYDFELAGAMAMGTHGDTVLNPGYPNRTIDVANLKKQVNDINNARVTRGQDPYRLFIMGHVHVGSMTHLPGGVTIMTNGCLIPPDPYAQSIGIFDTSCGQWMFESVEGHPVGDARFITVDREQDEDESLDEIIKPFKGL